MITGLLLQPNRSVTAGSKEEKNLPKAFVESLAEKRGAGFFVTPDISGIVLGGRKGKDGLDFGAGLFTGPEQSNLTLHDEPDENGRTDSISLAVKKFTGSDAQVLVSSRSGRNVNLTASEPYQSGKTELPGEAAITLSEPVEHTKTASTPFREAELALKSEGSAGLDFSAEGFKTQARFDIDEDGAPHLDLFDSDGKLRAALGSTDLEVTATGASEKTAPSSLTLFDKKGKLVWRTP